MSASNSNLAKEFHLQHSVQLTVLRDLRPFSH